ncbi:MAG TPA: FAD-dependent oxidoreductase [Vicinamibacterales bacterium]|nr:FAD-dependent oxidoreductase [Vicinamibacterales bacterium]
MTQKLACVVERVVAHGDRVYTAVLRPDRRLPRFRAGQFLHLAIDAYDPSGFWPESRVFSIASAPTDRDRVRITYAVHGPFTTRMESAVVEGGSVWIKLPYGDFVVEEATDVALVAGGTGITAFSAFLEGLLPSMSQKVVLAYGARSPQLLVYRHLIEECRARVPGLQVVYFVEHDTGALPDAVPGRVCLEAVWPKLRAPLETNFYIAGPPAMIDTIRGDLQHRGIAAEMIHVDAWE